MSHARAQQPAKAGGGPGKPTGSTARKPAGAGNAARSDLLTDAGRVLSGAAASAGDLAQRLTRQGKGDIRREGTLTDPSSRKPVPMDTALADARGSQQPLGAWLMERYAFQPKGEHTTAADDETLRFFSPGLNTPEPEASRRTAYYADALGQPMLHLHNGTNADAKVPGATQLDYVTAGATRAGIGKTPLMDSMVKLLQAALTGARPQDVHAILYSDSTIAGSRAIATVRQQMIDQRVRNGASRKAAMTETDALLEKHLFVEMHGNVVADLPRGPRYVLWADEKDSLTHGDMAGRQTGLSGRQRDDDAKVLYVDYDGPYGGADAHNLGAVGVHAVRDTWNANGVSSSQELFERQAGGKGVKVPERTGGDASRLWNPRNDPKWGKKK
jgi:hypothetical protein